jgi:hydrogenase nickel incorporation protein HypB
MKRDIKVYRGLMGANEKWAQKTREWLAERKLSMLNLIGAPGSGKTALLEKTREITGDTLRFAVLEGDVETTRDAERLTARGIPASQLLTDGACHLEAKLVHYALRDLPAEEIDLVIVENVGNMVCPVEFDIGEKAKVAVTSVAEGEDKALKYPLLFRTAGVVVLTKIDLLPHVPFDIEACRRAIRQVNPRVPLFELSALTGQGVEAWIAWLRSSR